MPAGTIEIVNEIVNITFFLIKYRKKILAYLQENKTEKKCYRYAFTAIGMIVFLEANLALAFSGIQKLS